MVYTFKTPWDMERTKNIIQHVVKSMNGKVKEISPGVLKAKWRTQPYHSKQYHTLSRVKFMFYIGDRFVDVTSGDHQPSELIIPKYKLGGRPAVWNAFIESLQREAPSVNFGIRPGDVELVAVQFFGNGIKEVYEYNTVESPNYNSALWGYLAFGAPGLLLGALDKRSRTVVTRTTKDSGRLATRAIYSNGEYVEGFVTRNSILHRQLMAGKHLKIK